MSLKWKKHNFPLVFSAISSKCLFEHAKRYRKKANVCLNMQNATKRKQMFVWTCKTLPKESKCLFEHAKRYQKKANVCLNMQNATKRKQMFVWTCKTLPKESILICGLVSPQPMLTMLQLHGCWHACDTFVSNRLFTAGVANLLKRECHRKKSQSCGGRTPEIHLLQ